MSRALRSTVLALLLVLVAAGVAPAARPAVGPIVITPLNPLPGTVTSDPTPNITAAFSDSASAIDPASVTIDVDGSNVTSFQQTFISGSGVAFAVPSILKLGNGNHSVTIAVGDVAGNHAQYSWGFVVNTSAASPTGPSLGVSPFALVEYAGFGAALAAVGFGSYILYLKRTRRFTFRKYFAIHPVNRQYFLLGIPAVAAFVFALIGLTYVYRTPGLPLLAPEYVVSGAVFIGLTAYAIHARSEKRRLRAYERAFAQFLFEMADAMRGGLDPAKAVVELSKTESNILQQHLRIAADGIRIGRPVDLVLRTMVVPMRSPLIRRYADLIADASAVGGETSAVVHRAAKDMDDFIKIEQERGTALAMPIAILYVAFGVLMAVLFALLNIAPSLGSINVSFLGVGSPLANHGATAAGGVPHLEVSGLRQRFFDLMAINAVGTGAIIGAFAEGRPKYGLVHSLALLGATVVAFAFFAP